MPPPTFDPEEVELASGFTVHDYKLSLASQSRDRIAEAIRKRFSERYINAARADTPFKHGFTMMAISCLMIEALESFRQGWITSNGRSKAAFCFFFDHADEFSPFRGYAEQFYINVRCGILHQAETTGAWRIMRIGPMFDSGTLTVNAALFLESLQRVLNAFCDQLKTAAWDSDEWKRILKKMDAICANCKR
jgi:hypothetical protein